MEEHLKTLRSQLQILVAVCIAIGAFASSVDQSERFRLAQQDLKILRDLSIKQYAASAHRDLFGESLQYSTDVSRSLGVRVDWTRRAIYCEWPGQSATVGDYLEFFDGPPKTVLFLSASQEAIVAEYKNASAKFSRDYAIKPVLRGVVIRQPRDVPQLLVSMSTLGVNWSTNRGKETSDATMNQFPIALSIQGITPDPRVSLGDTFEYMEAGPNIHLIIGFVFEVSVPGGVNELISWQSTDDSILVGHGYDPKAWLDRELQARKITIHGKPFPGLRAVADLVGGRSPSDAAPILQAQIDAAKRQFEVGGITIDVGIALWFAPVVVGTLLLYFLTHVHQAIALLEADDTFRIQAHRFPLLILFPGKLSRALSYSSIAILPVLCNYLLLRRILGASALLATGPLVELLGLSLVSVYTCIEVARLRLRSSLP